jgi:hypothetical protein
MVPVAASAASTISNGTIWVSSPRWPGASTPEATLIVVVMVATAGEGAEWDGNGAPGVDVILVDHVLTGAPFSCHLATPNPLTPSRIP